MKRLIATAAALMVMVTVLPAPKATEASDDPLGWRKWQSVQHSSWKAPARFSPVMWEELNRHPSGKRARRNYRYIALWFDVAPSKLGKLDVAKSWTRDPGRQGLQIWTDRKGYTHECDRTLSKKNEWCRVIIESPKKVKVIDFTLQVKPNRKKKMTVGTWRLPLEGKTKPYAWNSRHSIRTSEYYYLYLKPQNWSYKSHDNVAPYSRPAKNNRYILIDYEVDTFSNAGYSFFGDLMRLVVDDVKYEPIDHGYGRNCEDEWVEAWISRRGKKVCRVLFEIHKDVNRPSLHYGSWGTGIGDIPLVPQTRK